MAKTKRPTAWEKEWALLQKREQTYLSKHAQYKQPKLNQLLEGKVPPKLQDTLDLAFTKAFGLIFEKGTPLLERTLSTSEISKRYQENQFSADLRQDRKSLRAFSRRSGQAEALNLTISGVEGVVLGALGVGIPDIPVFTGVMLRSLYEMAGHFGFPYDTAQERYFQLLLIQGALSYGDELLECDQALNRFIEAPSLPVSFDLSSQISKTAQALSRQLLYMKFLQGIPIVGVAGGAYDMVCLNQIQRFAKLKYQRRLLLQQKVRTQRQSQT